MTADGDRPQDVGRRHRRSGQASPETAALLARYQTAMRSDLADLLGMLAPAEQDQGLGIVKVQPKRPDLQTRSKIWDLAIKLGRELGAAIDVPPPSGPAATTRRARRPKVDYGD